MTDKKLVINHPPKLRGYAIAIKNPDTHATVELAEDAAIEEIVRVGRTGKPLNDEISTFAVYSLGKAASSL